MATAVAVKERPILFSAPMVRAILDGRKTMTRRIIKPQPEDLGSGVWNFRDDVFTTAELEDHLFHNVYGGDDKAFPYGGVYEDYGDRLWVRETIQRFNREPPTAQYAADLTGVPAPHGIPRHTQGAALWKWQRKSLPSIHMPRWASRITIELTDVRLQRLHEISESDAIAEGADHWWKSLGREQQERIYDGGRGPVASFRQLWTSINGDGSWESNPWVWAITFKRVEVHHA